jgi:Raf kinase inhibitor-like YbhB/YbcL family protein
MEQGKMAIRQAAMALFGVAAFAASGCSPNGRNAAAAPSSAAADGKPLAITQVKSKGAVMVVSSPVFADGGPIPDIYTGYGKGYSPPVMWTPVPGAKSYVVVIEDPDAPGSAPFLHWLVYDIPSTVTALDDPSQGGALPDGVRQGVSSAGSAGYSPLKPPVGDKPHHYHVEVFALDAAPQLSGTPDFAALLHAMTGHVLADGETVGVYTPNAPGGGADPAAD